MPGSHGRQRRQAAATGWVQAQVEGGFAPIGFLAGTGLPRSTAGWLRLKLDWFPFPGICGQHPCVAAVQRHKRFCHVLKVELLNSVQATPAVPPRCFFSGTASKNLNGFTKRQMRIFIQLFLFVFL